MYILYCTYNTITTSYLFLRKEFCVFMKPRSNTLKLFNARKRNALFKTKLKSLPKSKIFEQSPHLGNLLKSTDHIFH